MFTTTKFELSEEQMKKIEVWDHPINGHKCKAKISYFRDGTPYKEAGTIGGYLSVWFSPTSIGMYSAVCCSFCKQELDITEYELW